MRAAGGEALSARVTRRRPPNTSHPFHISPYRQHTPLPFPFIRLFHTYHTRSPFSCLHNLVPPCLSLSFFLVYLTFLLNMPRLSFLA